jgi:L-2,4-diaminobutyric acid acetyltransferase
MAKTPCVGFTDADHLLLEPPSVDDGPDLWRLVRETRTLDLNSEYHYLLWCRDFAATSVVARHEGAACGFVTGYVRPDVPDTLMVWQVAVAPALRGHGIAGRMLGELLDRRAPFGQVFMEATVTPDNAASIALFTALGRDRAMPISRCDLFTADQFRGGGHQPEVLFRIGPAVAGT